MYSDGFQLGFVSSKINLAILIVEYKEGLFEALVLLEVVRLNVEIRSEHWFDV